MKWGTHLSKEVRGVKKAYKKKTEEQLKQYQEKWANHAPELQNKILKLYWDMDSAWDRNENVKADRISNKIFELENELGRGHNKIDREYDELVKKSKKQYGKDLVEARLKAYNRLYRRPFRRKELQHYEEELYHYGKLGMRWGIRRRAQKIIKDTPSKIKSEKEQRRARVNETLASIDSKSRNPKYGKGSNNTYKKLRKGYDLEIDSYNDALRYHRNTGNHQGYDIAFRNAEKYQDRFLKVVKEVDKLYQSGTPNEKHLKRFVDVAYGG